MSLFGWFRKKQAPVDRYAGKPFLKFVDGFVLKCIGALDPKEEALLVQLTPMLGSTFSSTGSWEEIVIEQLRFAPDIRAEIRAMWERNQVIARENGVELTAMQFVEMFVAENVEGQ